MEPVRPAKVFGIGLYLPNVESCGMIAEPGLIADTFKSGFGFGTRAENADLLYVVVTVTKFVRVLKGIAEVVQVLQGTA